MKIRLVDVDSVLANLALMKISGYYRYHGGDVNWFNPILDHNADRIYSSKIFQFTNDIEYYPETEIIRGGTGFDVDSKLPECIENFKKVDYSIYPKCDYSVQFFSRGCIRNCPFCVVRQKEGYIYPVDPVELNPVGNHIEVLDNNFFANPNWREAAKMLTEWKQPVNFHGIDIRIMDEEQARCLNKIKQHKQIHVAWDNPKEDIIPHFERVIKWIKPYKLMCYVLIGFWSTPEQDLYRVEKLRDLKIDPFVMPFDKSDRYQRNFARWCNHKAIFKSVKWHDYKKVV